MDRPASPALLLPDFARGLATQIERRMEDLDAELRAATATGRLADADAEVFGEFQSFLTLALERYRPTPPQSRGIGRLVFQPLYDEAEAALAAVPRVGGRKGRTRINLNTRPTLLAALMAAHVETLGPLRLTRDQAYRLATVLIRLGEAFEQLGMLAHAAAAYERAAVLYRDNNDQGAEDRCLRKLAGVRHHALPFGIKRAAQRISGTLVGYGFAPYRMLVFMGVQLVLACVLLVLLSRKGTYETLYMAAQDYINPAGLGDTENMSRWAWMILVIESYLGTINFSIFFALLVRKWFRT